MTTGNEARNLVFEIEMKARAAHRYEKQLQRAIEGGRAATVEPYKGALRRMIREAEKVVAEAMKPGKAWRPLAGPKLLALAGVKPSVATFIAAKTVLDSIGRTQVAQSLIHTVGSRLEDEARFMQFKKREPKLWSWMIDQMERRGSQDYTHKHRVLAAAMHRTDPDGWVKWTHRDKTHVGMFLLDALMTTGMLQKSKIPGRRRFALYITLTEDAERAISDREELVRETLRPWYMPILCPPKPWTTPFDGGYHAYPMPLVKTNKRQWLETVGQQYMPKVYESLNAIQATPWKVHQDVLQTAELLWEAGGDRAGLPLREDPPPPERPNIPPPGVELSPDQQELLKGYKALASAWHTEKMRRQAHVITAAMTLEVASLLQEEQAIWFPHQLDYRGRAYAVPLFLNPQSTDLARGLLRFAESVPVGDMGGYWLAVHGCNSFGNDKVPLDQRVDWVFENEADILRVCEDPIENRWWMEADEPWQFLAFCLEWGGYAESGYSPSFESSLPVSVDGSCNGLQHFSAMLRDPVGAEATNLTPREKPNDIYQQVADAVRRKVEEVVDAGRMDNEPDTRMARQWLAFGIDRGLVKRQVMTTPYGATQPGMLKQLLVEMQKRGDPPFENLWDACRYLTPIIYECIGQTVMAARKAMDFLQAVAKAAAKEEMPLSWVTPAGFPVLQSIPSLTQYRVKTLLLGAIHLQFSTQSENKLDRRRQASASAPNFIHSFDAAHLMLTVCAMGEKHGPSSWCFVHDSFGTHAGRMQALNDILREEFVKMYANRHALETFRKGMQVLVSAELPGAPKLGDFDVRVVEQAEFFFA